MSTLDLLPIYGEYPEDIRARLLASMNAGVSPSDPMYASDVPGDPFSTLSGPVAQEFDLAYDRMNQIPAQALPATASGLHLERWADTLGIPGRKAPSKASGQVTITGTNGTPIPVGTPVSTTAPSPESPPVEFVTLAPATISGGSVTVDIEAIEAGTVGNVPANSVTLIDGVSGVASVTNADPITSGSDRELDESLSRRVLAAMRGTTGSGNVDYYVNLILGQPGVGVVTVHANDPAPGNVRIDVADVNNDPVSGVLLSALQALVDPSTSSAQGAGQAPIGAAVTITTPSPETTDIVVPLTFRPGYSLDGAGGTIACGPAVEAAVREYVDSLGVGDDVIRNHIIGAAIVVEGVANVGNVLIDGSPTDKAIASTKVAVVGTFTAS